MTEEALQVKINEYMRSPSMKRGLVTYRAGKLPEAVVLGKKSALFSPEYSPSKVAIQTANSKLKILKDSLPLKPTD